MQVIIPTVFGEERERGEHGFLNSILNLRSDLEIN